MPPFRLLPGLALALLPLAAPAGDLSDAAAAVEAAVAAQDFAAWQAAEARLDELLWYSAGLHFGTLTLVSAPASGYRMYDSRADNLYAQGEPILLYAEPRGYGYGTLDTGQLQIAFDIDLTVKDTASGEVSLCREKDGQIVCRMAADERAAFEKELDLLTKRVEALEKGGATALTDAKPSLPTDEEIDRTMTIMEKMMQRFMGIVKNLEEGEEETTPGKDTVPQKT